LEEARDQRQQLEQVLAEVVHTNRQMDLLNERLAATRLAAEEAHKAKATFVAKVSHEFRTPLNMIIGLTDLLLETPDLYGESLPNRLFDDLQIVQRNCQHLASMINDVLDISQTEAGRLAVRREWVDLATEAESALTTVQPLIEKKRLQLRCYLAPDLPEVYCDRTRIRQVLLNLISNAARYTETGEISVTVAHDGLAVTLSVADTGPGIPTHELQEIFEPFYQAGNNGSWRDRSGSGLGLTISKQFIELHHGQIWVESEVGRGSTFFVRLPIFPPAPPTARTSRWIHEEWQWVERAERPEIPRLNYSHRVIICDEPGDLAEDITGCNDEIEFVHVTRPDEVAKALADSPAHAVILRTDEPDTLFHALRLLSSQAPDTPLVAYALPHPEDRAVAAGADAYLVKPVTRSDIQQAFSMSHTRPAKVLLVDDNHDFRQLLGRMIRVLDPEMTIVEAADGREAIQLLQSYQPDLIFLDLAMPNMDGWELLAEKRRMTTLQKTRVVVISAQDPLQQESHHGMLLATIGAGITPYQLLRCTLSLSDQLLNPETAPAPAPE
jgi:signal transduction histidine kinase/CheY-like chemotaxis protein